MFNVPFLDVSGTAKCTCCSAHSHALPPSGPQKLAWLVARFAAGTAVGLSLNALFKAQFGGVKPTKDRPDPVGGFPRYRWMLSVFGQAFFMTGCWIKIYIDAKVWVCVCCAPRPSGGRDGPVLRTSTPSNRERSSVESCVSTARRRRQSIDPAETNRRGGDSPSRSD